MLIHDYGAGTEVHIKVLVQPLVTQTTPAKNPVAAPRWKLLSSVQDRQHVP